jgi:hypothetical protein
VSRERAANADKPNPAPNRPGASALWWLAGLLTFWSFGFTTMMGSDLWWHLASGRWIWQARTLRFQDPWSFTFLGKPWQSHEWLSDVIFYAWSRVAGMETLVWWKWAVLVGAFLTLFGVLRRLCASPLAAFLASLAAMAVGAPFFDIRPQLYSVLGFVLLLRLALLRSRWRWLLPIGFFFWVNLHGGFFFGLLALTTIFAVARLAGQSTKNDLPLWLGCLAACLVNPAGPDAFAFPLHYALKGHSPYLRIGEWRAPWESGGIRAPLYFPMVGVFVASVALLFAARLYRKDARLSLTSVALACLTLAMSLKSRRFIPLFGIAQSLVLAPVLAHGLSGLGQRLSARFARLSRLPWHYVFPAAALLLGASWLWPYPLSSRAFLYLTSQYSFPVEAMNVAETNQWTGKVFAYYEWGGYLDLRTGGRLKVYIDGRADTVFSDSLYRDYTRVLGLVRGWEKIVDDSGADFFLWPKRRKEQIEALRATGRWETLYGDHVATLLIRSDLAKPETRPSPDSPWRQLTLGWHDAREKDFAAAERHFESALAEMPNLRPACEWLAHVQAKQNQPADAERTLDRCQKLFPDKVRHQELLSFIRGQADSLN